MRDLLKTHVGAQIEDTFGVVVDRVDMARAGPGKEPFHYEGASGIRPLEEAYQGAGAEELNGLFLADLQFLLDRWVFLDGQAGIGEGAVGTASDAMAAVVANAFSARDHFRKPVSVLQLDNDHGAFTGVDAVLLALGFVDDQKSNSFCISFSHLLDRITAFTGQIGRGKEAKGLRCQGFQGHRLHRFS